MSIRKQEPSTLGQEPSTLRFLCCFLPFPSRSLVNPHLVVSLMIKCDSDAWTASTSSLVSCSSFCFSSSSLGQLAGPEFSKSCHESQMLSFLVSWMLKKQYFKWKRCIRLKNGLNGLETWLRRQEHCLLFQKSWVQFPTTEWWLITICNEIWCPLLALDIHADKTLYSK